jgi:hypothetical protein
LRVYTKWADTAIANFDKGVAIGMVLPKSIGNKNDIHSYSNCDRYAQKNIFYEPVLTIPTSFSVKKKRDRYDWPIKMQSTKIILTENWLII